MRSRRSSPKSVNFGSEMGLSASYRRDVESGRVPTGILARLTPRRVALGTLAGLSVLGYLWVSGSLDQGVLSIIADNLDAGDASEPVYSYIVDEYGDHFIQDYSQDIPTFDPDISLLPAPEAVFATIDLRTHLRPPPSNPYPTEKMWEIHNPPKNPIKEEAKRPVPSDAYSETWRGPEGWDQGGKEMPRVQAEKFRGDRKLMQRRREAVRRGFAHAWQAYKDFAWGHDEVAPQSQVPTDPFNGWGASIIDTLDTLLILGFSDEYDLCRPHVNQVNFDWVGGRDWRHGYTIPAESIGVAEDIDVHRDNNIGFPVFETGIRYLGGLLGAYDLSGDELMLDRAVDLAEILSKAFYTNSGLPAGRMDPASLDRFTLYSVSSAEVGSMSLELIRLSEATGDRKWFDLAQRATEFLAENMAPKSEFAPMLPLYISPDASISELTGTYAWGGLIDSYYEYLIKVWHLLRGSPVSGVYKDLYERSVDKSREVLFKRTKAVPGMDLLTIGKYSLKHTIPEVEHLTCFAGAMLGLGAKLLGRDRDMADAQDFTNTCYWLSATTATGIQPDLVEFFNEGEEHLKYENVTLDGDRHHPHGDHLDIDAEDAAGRVVRDMSGNWHWKADGIPVHAEAGGREDAEPQGYYSRLKGSPPGTRKTSTRYLNRPETIESVYYMYRLTGDPKWQDRGWKMYVSWVTTAAVPGGISSINDVTRDPEHVLYGDNMESFTFAETFKYHYLLHADEDLISLDDYVLNTGKILSIRTTMDTGGKEESHTAEAHPFIHNPRLKPGSSRLWHGRSHSNAQELGERGQGTDVQKWTRATLMHTIRERYRPVNVQRNSGGRGMGGGGGDPNFRPKPPPGF